MTQTKPVYNTISKADFLSALVRDDRYYDLQGVGLVRIRGLSVKEAQTLYQKYEGSRADLVVNVIKTCVTEPELTEEDTQALYDAKAGPINTLFEEIMSMSAEATEQLQGEAGAGS